eukprot:CAMPEP_0174953748 /NCGR_PEP_ID=MMETSP0004_2-20121128/29_1 /TAXON_ID=420556 /ORGANISM="Ochromonas sp., Strain CCMP1393" /LENGTH=339 /DNA_ID=CAMNT_0016201461 /DNA_START=164 /DNA_END=1183 /DNA_ORIENTATION=-
MADVEEKVITSVEAPNFYWKFRLDRLVAKKGGELAFDAGNYDGVEDFKDLYDCYYLDLTIQGKLEGFDWQAEKKVSDSEWIKIYKSMCSWSKKTASANKPDTSNLPVSDFDLLKQFYPQLSLRDIETPFAAEEVGGNFPYRNMKDMLAAAVNGDLSVPGYSADSASLDTAGAKKSLASLKESTMSKVESLFNDAMSYATTPFPDDTAKSHYAALRSKLADFPQSPAEWDAYRAKMDKEVDEMARLASKKVDPHGHGEGMSPSQEFEAKYGKSLDEMSERMSAYKSDPVGFMEKSIEEKYGKNGLDVWKKSQEFSEKLSVMTDADKAAAEASFSDFLKKA